MISCRGQVQLYLQHQSNHHQLEFSLLEQTLGMVSGYITVVRWYKNWSE